MDRWFAKSQDLNVVPVTVASPLRLEIGMSPAAFSFAKAVGMGTRLSLWWTSAIAIVILTVTGVSRVSYRLIACDGMATFDCERLQWYVNIAKIVKNQTTDRDRI